MTNTNTAPRSVFTGRALTTGEAYRANRRDVTLNLFGHFLACLTAGGVARAADSHALMLL